MLVIDVFPCLVFICLTACRFLFFYFLCPHSPIHPSQQLIPYAVLTATWLLVMWWDLDKDDEPLLYPGACSLFSICY